MISAVSNFVVGSSCELEDLFSFWLFKNIITTQIFHYFTA